MTFRALTCSLLMAAAVCGGEGGSPNLLAPKGEAVAVTLARGGQPAYAIAGGGSAADMLREGLRVATGLDFPVADAPAAEGLARFVLDPDPAPDADDAFAVAVDADGAIRLTGHAKNAVAAFLEEDLGLRFFAPATGLERYGPPLTEARVTPRADAPAMVMRYPLFQQPLDPAWARFNRARPRKFCGDWGTHTFQWLVPNDPFFTTHPEWFALVDGKRWPGGNMSDKGQLCLTNPGLLDRLAQSALEKIAADPGCEILAVSQNDFARWCQCGPCRALVREEGSEAGPLLHAVNHVARAVRERFPKVVILTDGYVESRTPPRRVRPEANVLFRLCLSDRIDRTQYVPVAETREGDYLRRWRAILPELYVWDYCADFTDYLLPQADYPALEANFRFFREQGVTGSLLLGHYADGADTAQKRLRMWVAGKLMWNPERPVADLVRDFNARYYGPGAGGAMQRYSELQDEAWRAWYAARTGDRFVWPDDFAARAEALFADALAAAASDEYRARVERELAAVRYLTLLRDETPPGDAGDVDARLAAWLDLCRRHGITRVMEGVRAPEDVAPRLRYRERERKLEAGAPKGWRYLLPATRAFIEHGAKLVDDPKAELGMAASSAGDSTKWGIHWHLDDFPEIDLAATYRVVALVRADLLKPTGAAVKTTWWNAVTNALPGEFRTLAAEELSPDRYRWIDCGTLSPDAGGVYLLFSALDNGVVERLYLQGVALVAP